MHGLTITWFNIYADIEAISALGARWCWRVGSNYLVSWLGYCYLSYLHLVLLLQVVSYRYPNLMHVAFAGHWHTFHAQSWLFQRRSSRYFYFLIQNFHEELPLWSLDVMYEVYHMCPTSTCSEALYIWWEYYSEGTRKSLTLQIPALEYHIWLLSSCWEIGSRAFVVDGNDLDCHRVWLNAFTV